MRLVEENMCERNEGKDRECRTNGMPGPSVFSFVQVGHIFVPLVGPGHGVHQPMRSVGTS